MKEKLKNKKLVYTIIGIISVLLVAVAVTYAYWLVTKSQQGENVISSGCLDISLNGTNDITLSDQFPMSDEDGMKLTPYEFTVTNNCNTSVDYQIALEAIGEESASISSNALKVALNDDAKLFSSYAEVDTTVEGAYESRILGFSRLSAKGSEGASDSYSLRIWIDENADISEMNKIFKSKISVTIGQGIELPYEEGTLAYSILSNYGGSEGIQTLSTEWTEGEYGTETYQSMTKSTSYYWGTEMDFNETNGRYKLGGTVVQATVEECRNGQKSDGTAITCSYTVSDRESADSELINGYKVTSLTSSEKTDTGNNLYITVQYTGTASNSFSKVTTASDANVYKTQDDLGDSYYFRGAPTNNYVEFGTYAEDTTLTVYDYNNWEEKTIEVKAGDPMYWRIVRINGDGSVRLVYDGVEKVANGVAHTATIAHTAYNTNYDNAKYVGYTYEGTNEAGETIQVDSTIKGVVDAWYDKHLETTYGTYIADSIFCNDRQVTSGSEEYPNFAPYDRLGNGKTPSVKCTNKADRYTMDDTTNGNGHLSNPVGLLTADEVAFAGGVAYSGNTSFYLHSVEMYWTFAPYDFDGSDAYVWTVDGVGNLNYDYYVGDSIPGARPVINLKADTLIEGKGTIDSPYKLASQN